MPSAESARQHECRRQPERGGCTTQNVRRDQPLNERGAHIGPPARFLSRTKRPMSAVNAPLAAPESDSKCPAANESFPASGNVPLRDSPTWPSTEKFR